MSLTRCLQRATLCAAVIAPLTVAAQTDTTKKNYEFSGNLGFSQTGGNADLVALNGGNKYKYVRNGWTFAQDFQSFYGEADNTVNANFWNGGVRGERALTPRIGLFIATRFDRNALQGISRRFEEGFGLSIKAIERPKDILGLTVGGSILQTTFSPGISTANIPRNYPAARVGADYKHLFSKVAYFQQIVELLPNLSDSEALLANAESAIVAPISTNIGLKIGYVMRYNGVPPVRNGRSLKKTDTFLSSGVTFSY
jgi:putative salt-induced outer membrane protein